MLRALQGAAARLDREVAEVDALNVYPLPDGDTGRNLQQTIAAAIARAREAGSGAGDVTSAAAQGALMGARGNSGVIFSQIMRGIRDGFAGASLAGPEEVRRAFELACRNARSAVERPAEGTMLTLCDELNEAVVGAVQDAVAMLRAAAERGTAAVERTMEANPMNRAAGVVDAGAYGLWLLLVGALAAVEGRERRLITPRLRRPGAEGVRVVGEPIGEVASWSGGHCVQYVIRSPTRPAGELRAEMVERGADSVLVVGDESLLRVHAHALQPEVILAIGRTAGEPAEVEIEDFDEMVAEHERATGISIASPPRPFGALAVVPSDGFARIVRPYGASVVRGGATMNPSVGELVTATERINAGRVVLLPNDKNVLLAAREAAREVATKERRVDVVESTNIAQGIAALVRFEPNAPAERLDDIVAQMRSTAAETRAIEVTRATRATSVEGIDVRANEVIALLDGRLVAHGDDEVDVLGEAAGKLEDVGILTLYYGAGVEEATARRAADRLRAACPGVESVEVFAGGQPHYPFIVQAE